MSPVACFCNWPAKAHMHIFMSLQENLSSSLWLFYCYVCFYYLRSNSLLTYICAISYDLLIYCWFTGQILLSAEMWHTVNVQRFWRMSSACLSVSGKWNDQYFDKFCECLCYVNFYLMSLYTGWIQNHRWIKPKISIYPRNHY